MKRTIAILLALAMIFALCACGSAKSEPAAPAPAQGGETAPAAADENVFGDGSDYYLTVAACPASSAL